jgi:hypothetical protein
VVSPRTLSHIDSLLNLVFLCRMDARKPNAVLSYMRLAQLHLDGLIEAEELRPRYEERKIA